MKKLISQWTVPLLLMMAAACSNGGTTTNKTNPNVGPRPQGQTSFKTPLNGGGRFSGGEDAAAGSSSGGAPSNGQTGGGTAAPRLVEESDIYKLDGNTLFVLNRYRGLQVLDITNLDAPTMVGHAPIYGYPKDMYIRGDRAYVIVSDYYSFWRGDDAVADAWGANWGSQLRILDISNRASPVVISSIGLQGDCGDSRIVGDVMYLVSHRYPWWGGYATNDTEDMTQVLSVSIADENDIHVVDTEEFPRNGWEHHLHVTANTIYLAATSYQSSYDINGQWQGSYSTDIRYVDISDPQGAIRLRGEFRVPGQVQDRWAMDEYQGVLRVASGQSWGNGDVFLTTIDAHNPDALFQAGSYTLHVNENLQSARFDGPRGYLVSYRNIDPLFSFDLSNPASPVLLGELQMTGWLDFMVPMGDRVVALGHEDTVDANGNRNFSLQVSLIDVAQATPVLLSRVHMDGAWGWVPSSRDDFAKVFRVLPELGLVVFPFQAWNQNDWHYVGGVQLIDASHDTLTKRGLIQNAGWVERGIVHGQNTVLTLSSEVFQIMDITNRDAPALRSRLELARNVGDFLVAGDYTVQLSGDWWLGDTYLTVTPKSDPDSVSPVASIHVPAPYGRIYRNGNLLYVSSLRQSTDGTTPSQTVVQVVDISNPAAPVVRGSVTLPEPVQTAYGYWYWGGGDEVAQVDGSLLVFHRFSYRGWGDCYGCGYNNTPNDKIIVVDLSNADAPSIASVTELTDITWSWGLKVSGRKLYLTDYTSFQEDNNWFANYHLRTIDVTNPAAPSISGGINVPGNVVAISDDGETLYTVEGYYDSTTGQYQNWLHALRLFNGLAYLQSSVGLNGYAYDVKVSNNHAYTVSYWYGALDSNANQYVPHTQLSVVDLSDASNLHLSAQVAVPTDWGYLQKVEGGRAFIGAGPGLFVYDVRTETPRFEQFFRTYGWVQDVVLDGTKAFLPSGYYGVQVLDLTAENNPI